MRLTAQGAMKRAPTAWSQAAWRACRFWVVAFTAMLAGCTGGSSNSQAPEPPVDALACTPNAHRACDCEIGVGEQSCAPDGTRWRACLCPLKALEFAEDTVELQTPMHQMNVSEDGRTLRMPQAGNARYAQLEPGTIVVRLEGKGFMGRVIGTSTVGDEVVIETEPVELFDAFDRIAFDFDTRLNVDGYLPEEVLRLQPVDAIGLSGGVSGGGLSLTGAGAIEPSIDFLPESRVWFEPQVSASVDVTRFPPDLNAFNISANLNAGFELYPVVGVSGMGSAEVALEVIQLAMRIATGSPKTVPLTIILGGGLTAEVTINLRCKIEAGGKAAFTTRLLADVQGGGAMGWNEDSGFAVRSWLEADADGGLEAFDWEAQAVLRCEVKPELRLRFVNVGYAAVDIGPYAQAGVYFGPNPRFAIEMGVDSKANIGASLDVEAVNISFFNKEFVLFDTCADGSPLAGGCFTPFEHKFSVCGDGYRQLEEDCDDGVLDGGCTAECTCPEGEISVHAFGVNIGRSMGTRAEGQLWGVGANGCRSSCGDGVHQPEEGELCDHPEGAPRGRGDCAADCMHRFDICGDGFVDWTEDCDDGNTEPCDGCGPDCTLLNSAPVCGDGRVDNLCGEYCERTDRGIVRSGWHGLDTTDPPAWCGDDCRMTDVGECGDGRVNIWSGIDPECAERVIAAGGEIGDARFECPVLVDECDDGNDDNCDGCVGASQNARDWRFFGYGCKQVDPGCGDAVVCGDEECDDGPLNAIDGACLPGCLQARCGDGFVQADREACDDGPEGSERCTAQCTLSRCGDGIINVRAGEMCESGVHPGDPPETNDCTADCQAKFCGDGVVQPERGETCDVLRVCGDDVTPCSRDADCEGIGDGVCPAIDINCPYGQAECEVCQACQTVRGVARFCGDGVVQAAWGETCDPTVPGVRTTAMPCRYGEADCELCVEETCELVDGTQGFCGDGVVQPQFEACDDGAADACGDCANDCSHVIGVCGDGFVDDEPGCVEACDDGGAEACVGDCNADCSARVDALGVCGNGAVEPEACEICENTAPDDDAVDQGCTADAPNCLSCAGCNATRCGNGVLEVGEVCEVTASCGDVGNHCADGTACRRAADCEGVGDGMCRYRAFDACLLNQAFCQDGSPCEGAGDCQGIGDERCSAACRNGSSCEATVENRCVGCSLIAQCGNGVVEGPEVCDDGRHCADGRPCLTANHCVHLADTACRPRPRDGCAFDCLSLQADCGNGQVEPGEQCDPGRRCLDGTGCVEHADCMGLGDDPWCLTRASLECAVDCRLPQ